MNLMEQIKDVPEIVQLTVLQFKGRCAMCEHGSIDNEHSGLCTCMLDGLIHWYNPDCPHFLVAKGTEIFSTWDGDYLWKF